ncbi:MAG: helix-turn-helix domain-containing protein [Prevotellaceae bacterium]|jgi:transcriptional regulator with XRE-family HTH domain|nr:helix-turn-helix domain-containing protein [Prevotellaceae bacterium]
MNEITFKLKTDEIRRIRRDKDLSQDYMAEILGLSQSQYSRLENGESAISIDKVIEIAHKLNVPCEDIIDGDIRQIFNNCSQSGNNIEKIETINNHSDFEQERKSLLMFIENLQKDNEFLKTQNAELLSRIQKPNK